MSDFDPARKLLYAKIVYWGPQGSGKTCTLSSLRRFLDPEGRLRLYSVTGEGERTLYFDLLALEEFSLGPYRVRTRLFAVPGDAAEEQVRRFLIAGVDVVVFVADARRDQIESGAESLRELERALRAAGRDPAQVPIVVALNHQDTPDAISARAARAALGTGDAPIFETVAARQTGVYDCFGEAFRRMVVSLVETHGILAPDVENAAPQRFLPQLARGALQQRLVLKDDESKHVMVRVPDPLGDELPQDAGVEQAARAARAMLAQVRLAELCGEAHAGNRILEDRNKELMAINRVARSILGAMQADNLLVVLLDATAEHLQATHASCVVFDPSDKGSLRTHVLGFGRDPALGLAGPSAAEFFQLLQESDG
ncbi:MAG: hypothetical protein ACREID_09325, partial [Planctomycetota bacterium]